MGREAKGLSKGRYDETFAGEDANQKPGVDQSMITIFIQSADRRANYQPIRYLFNGITLEMNLSIYKALTGVH